MNTRQEITEKRTQVNYLKDEINKNDNEIKTLE